jgi:CheY-like chemotaxis protein
MSARRARILLVEDNMADAELTCELLDETGIVSHIDVATDGEEALTMLRAAAGADGMRPHLVLLDLNLPKKDGREVLAELKEDPSLRRIPVVVLTTSSSAVDIARVYELQANAYVTKPVNLPDFLRVIESVKRFWLTLARLPAA